MKKKYQWLVAGAAAVTLTFAATTVVSAQNAPLEHNGATLHSEDKVQGIWTSVIADYPEPLPEGVAFPAEATTYFPNLDVSDDEPGYYEDGLVESVLGEFWKCAWLDVSLSGASSRSADGAVVAEQLEKSEGLPGPVTVEEVPGEYADFVEDESAEFGLTVEQYEFETNCVGYYTNEVSR